MPLRYLKRNSKTSYQMYYNVDDFSTYIKETHGKNLLFICNNQIQNIVNNSGVCTSENIQKVIVKIMDNEFYVDSMGTNYDYAKSYDDFTQAFIKYPYNRFNYFFCDVLSPVNNLAAKERVVIYFPLKYREPFYKKLCKLSELKAFL